MSNVGDPELMNQLNDVCAQLDQGIKLMGKYGREYAQANHDYKVAVNQEAYKMRTAGEAVTLISLTIKGREKVAPLMLKRDTAESLYETAKENINVLKLRARLLEAQIDREYKG